MYLTKNREQEIAKLKSKIRSNAFSLRKNKWHIRRDRPPHPLFNENSITVDSFVQQLAVIIWKHLQHKKPELRESLLQDAKVESSEKRFAKMKQVIQGWSQDESIAVTTGWISKSTADKVLRLIKKDLDKQLKAAQKTSYDYKEFVQDNPHSHAWKDREDKVIYKINTLYKYTLLPDSQIAYNMAIIFAASNFWTDYKHREDRIAKYYFRVRERIRKIKQKPTSKKD